MTEGPAPGKNTAPRTMSAGPPSQVLVCELFARRRATGRSLRSESVDSALGFVSVALRARREFAVESSRRTLQIRHGLAELSAIPVFVSHLVRDKRAER